jgi:hypothetical protein
MPDLPRAVLHLERFVLRLQRLVRRLFGAASLRGLVARLFAPSCPRLRRGQPILVLGHLLLVRGQLLLVLGLLRLARGQAFRVLGDLLLVGSTFARMRTILVLVLPGWWRERARLACGPLCVRLHGIHLHPGLALVARGLGRGCSCVGLPWLGLVQLLAHRRLVGLAVRLSQWCLVLPGLPWCGLSVLAGAVLCRWIVLPGRARLRLIVLPGLAVLVATGLAVLRLIVLPGLVLARRTGLPEQVVLRLTALAGLSVLVAASRHPAWYPARRGRKRLVGHAAIRGGNQVEARPRSVRQSGGDLGRDVDGRRRPIGDRPHAGGDHRRERRGDHTRLHRAEHAGDRSDSSDHAGAAKRSNRAGKPAGGHAASDGQHPAGNPATGERACPQRSATSHAGSRQRGE